MTDVQTRTRCFSLFFKRVYFKLFVMRWTLMCLWFSWECFRHVEVISVLWPNSLLARLREDKPSNSSTLLMFFSCSLLFLSHRWLDVKEKISSDETLIQECVLSSDSSETLQLLKRCWCLQMCSKLYHVRTDRCAAAPVTVNRITVCYRLNTTHSTLSV